VVHVDLDCSSAKGKLLVRETGQQFDYLSPLLKHVATAYWHITPKTFLLWHLVEAEIKSINKDLAKKRKENPHVNVYRGFKPARRFVNGHLKLVLRCGETVTVVPLNVEKKDFYYEFDALPHRFQKLEDVMKRGRELEEK
jgi:hypothetical protein